MLKLIWRNRRLPAVFISDSLCLYVIFHYSQEHSWQWNYARFLLGAVAMVVTTVWGFGPRQLRWFGSKPFLSPNWLTLWRIPLIAAGFLIFLQAVHTKHEEAWHWFGYLIVVFGIALDRVDGKVATHILGGLKDFDSAGPPMAWAWFHDPEGSKLSSLKYPVPPEMDGYRRIILEGWLNQLTSPHTRLPMFRLEKVESNPDDQGQVAASQYKGHNSYYLRLTGIGEWLDPLVDKINFLPLFAWLAHLGYFHWAPALLMISADLTGTVFRPPFETTPPFNRLQRFVKQVKATPFGKSKFFLQAMTFIVAMPGVAGWLNHEQQRTSYQIATTMLAIAGLLGAFNVVSRLTIMVCILQKTGLSKRYQQFKEMFDHDRKDDDEEEEKEVPGVSSNGE